MEQTHKYDILEYRGKLYYRDALYNGLNVINSNYKVRLIRRHVE